MTETIKAEDGHEIRGTYVPATGEATGIVVFEHADHDHLAVERGHAWTATRSPGRPCGWNSTWRTDKRPRASDGGSEGL
jgi:hypothetical protein